MREVLYEVFKDDKVVERWREMLLLGIGTQCNAPIEIELFFAGRSVKVFVQTSFPCKLLCTLEGDVCSVGSLCDS